MLALAADFQGDIYLGGANFALFKKVFKDNNRFLM